MSKYIEFLVNFPGGSPILNCSHLSTLNLETLLKLGVLTRFFSRPPPRMTFVTRSRTNRGFTASERSSCYVFSFMYGYLISWTSRSSRVAITPSSPHQTHSLYGIACLMLYLFAVFSFTASSVVRKAYVGIFFFL